jgi:hypothetical protein
MARVTKTPLARATRQADRRANAEPQQPGSDRRDEQLGDARRSEQAALLRVKSLEDVSPWP